MQNYITAVLFGGSVGYICNNEKFTGTFIFKAFEQLVLTEVYEVPLCLSLDSLCDNGENYSILPKGFSRDNDLKGKEYVKLLRFCYISKLMTSCNVILFNTVVLT